MLILAKWLLAASAFLAGLWLFLRWKYRLPPQGKWPKCEVPGGSTEKQGKPSGKLYDLVSGLLTGKDEGLHSVFPLAEAMDALAIRIQLIRNASHSIDLQYYIWHLDTSGRLLLEEIYAAAERGVRVRMLLDDNGIGGMDTILLRLNRHPLIEVRLFNPFPIRRPKILSWLIAPRTLNRRMHNKSMVADGQITVVGGRNIGDEYFGMSEGTLFADLDVMLAGPVVQQVQRDFEAYWFSSASFPISELVPQRKACKSLPPDILGKTTLAQQYLGHLEAVPDLATRLTDSDAVIWAKVSMVSDSPAKVTGHVPQSQLLFTRLLQIIGTPKKQFDLISPYFVPTRLGRQNFVELANAGVKVRVLTNSFQATDVAIVHCGYAPVRKPLLKAGIELFELRGAFGKGEGRKKLISLGKGSKGRATGITPRSRASALHAKTFAVDGERVFVGSFNFDQRSIRLNMELGFMIESPLLARQVSEIFDQRLDPWAFRLFREERGGLCWEEHLLTGEKRLHRKEPGTNCVTRTLVRLVSRLPIHWLL